MDDQFKTTLQAVVDSERGQQLIEKIRTNRKRLNECKVHNFGNLPEPLMPNLKLTCSNCNGIMDVLNAFEYANGFAAAGGDPNQVIHNFR